MMNKNEKKKILLVDDDEIHLAIAEAILETEYYVFTASSGKNALEYLLQGLAPDLILLDIIMPEMDGWETYNRLRAVSLLKKVPIAFLSSEDGATEKKHVEAIGAKDYITKPYSEEDLLERIRLIVENTNVYR